ncbi:hypothetical protein ON010_g6815 [Phytophthora cinnamomi]|nr:hypothetical protein ON010_g6815 [Phytophthora cinnamomi]
MKKLVWRLRRNSSDLDDFVMAAAVEEHKRKMSEAALNREATCTVCHKSFGLLDRKTTCKSCEQAVCPRCRVKKRVCVLAPDQRTVLEKRRSFCAPCIAEVTTSNARTIAKEELQVQEEDQDRAVKQSEEQVVSVARQRTTSWMATSASFRSSSTWVGTSDDRIAVAYEPELLTKDGHADSRAWKELRRKDNIRVYKERPRPNAMPTTPSLLLLGTVKGNLDDVMYAIVTPTEQAMKIKSNCTHDGVIDRKVLHEIVRPSVDDPFRHVSVNWSLYADSEPHDYVCVEATGVTHTLRGERVGFHLSHSVAFTQLPSFSESHGVERGNRSICSLYRETTAGEVECYVRGFFDFRDGDNELTTNIALHAIANQWLSFSRQIEFSHMKNAGVVFASR